MTSMTRRRLLAGIGPVAAGGIGITAKAAVGPSDEFDLVIKGGNVLDPSRRLRAKRGIGIPADELVQFQGTTATYPAIKTFGAVG